MISGNENKTEKHGSRYEKVGGIHCTCCRDTRTLKEVRILINRWNRRRKRQKNFFVDSGDDSD
jgi:hypothetical protein